MQGKQSGKWEVGRMDALCIISVKGGGVWPPYFILIAELPQGLGERENKRPVILYN